MEQKNYTGLIPENKTGKEITAEASATFKDVAEAQAFYKIARERLLAVNDWGKRAGSLSADFQLTDGQGKEANRLARNSAVDNKINLLIFLCGSGLSMAHQLTPTPSFDATAIHFANSIVKNDRLSVI